MKDLYTTILEQFPSYVKAGSRMNFPSTPIACIERTLTDTMDYRQNISGGYRDIAGLPGGTYRFLDDMALVKGEVSSIWTGKTRTQVVRPGKTHNEEAIFLFPAGNLEWAESLYESEDDPLEVGAVALFLDGVVVAMYTPDRIQAKAHVWHPRTTPEMVVPANREAITEVLSRWHPTGDIKSSTFLEAVSEITGNLIDAYCRWINEVQMHAQNGRLI